MGSPTREAAVRALAARFDEQGRAVMIAPRSAALRCAMEDEAVSFVAALYCTRHGAIVAHVAGRRGGCRIGALTTRDSRQRYVMGEEARSFGIRRTDDGGRRTDHAREDDAPRGGNNGSNAPAGPPIAIRPNGTDCRLTRWRTRPSSAARCEASSRVCPPSSGGGAAA